jgi:hypothetical protein
VAVTAETWAGRAIPVAVPGVEVEEPPLQAVRNDISSKNNNISLAFIFTSCSAFSLSIPICSQKMYHCFEKSISGQLSFNYQHFAYQVM